MSTNRKGRPGQPNGAPEPAELNPTGLGQLGTATTTELGQDQHNLEVAGVAACIAYSQMFELGAPVRQMRPAPETTT